MKNLSGLAINQIETIFDNRKETEKKSTYGSRREYSEYLNNKYACLTPTKDSSVSINSSLHSKEASNPKTAEWLENTLSQMPDCINKICENSAKNVKRNGEVTDKLISKISMSNNAMSTAPAVTGFDLKV